MASTNVETFAAELKVPAEVLLEQLRAAGVDKKNPADPLSEADKERLLSALRASHGGGGDGPRRQKITVVRKQTSEIKQADATGKARTIRWRFVASVRSSSVTAHRPEPERRQRPLPQQHRSWSRWHRRRPRRPWCSRPIR